jgi:acyl-CoA reductase-like NAD-dependent aldehyde dehydrogenase
VVRGAARVRSDMVQTMRERYPMWLAGRPTVAGDAIAVTDKYGGGVVSHVAKADAGALDRAIAAAHEAEAAMRQLPAYLRREVLEHMVRRCTERKQELAEVLCVEAGKPITFARGEVDRLIDTLRCSAAWAERAQEGEVMDLRGSPRSRGYRGMWKRVPVGVCGFITPWNFPLNLVAHKVGPAIACGCPFILKPASATPISALLLGEMLAETELPAGAWSIVPMDSRDVAALVEGDRVRKLSFTGSAEVGWKLKARAGRKAVTLELGGNAGCIVDGGLTDDDVTDAVDRLAFGAYYQSGQSCISVQRVFVHRSLYNGVRSKLRDKVVSLVAGDPRAEETFVGPMISHDDARRVEAWVNEASAAGASVLAGGRRNGNVFDATLLEGVPRDAKVCREEVFGPVAVIEPFDDFDEALQAVNDSRFGLQAGVFTRDVHHVQRAWDELRVGGVIINDVPAWRADPMPYGGATGTDSGLGREGIRWAIESMTEPRLLVMRER